VIRNRAKRHLRITHYALRFWLVVGLSGVLIAACNQAAPTPTPTSPPNAVGRLPAAGTPEADAAAPAPALTPTPTPELSGRIVLWHSWAEADGDALAALLAQFRQAHPDLTVDTLFVAYNDLPQSYTDAVLAGSGPDVLLSASWWLGDLVAADVVQPLDELLAPNELAAYWPATLENLRRNHQLYGLPTHFELVSLFYNRGLIAEDQLPTTTEAWLALAQQNPQHGSGLYASLYHLYWGLPAYGAQLFDETGVVTLDRTEGAAQFLTWLATMSKTPGVFVDMDYGMLLDRFKKGEFAFFVDGPWAIDELRGALGDNLAITMLPAGPAGAAQPWLSAEGVFLNPRSAPDQQQRALTFARFLTSPAAGETLANTARRLPANQKARVSTDPLLQGFLQQAGNAQSLPALPELETVWGYGGDMLIKVINDVGDPQSIVAETTTLINEANGK
jgi:arabinogalactan oligomer / maltooligosaccharide transport system substrate-binding protein